MTSSDSQSLLERLQKAMKEAVDRRLEEMTLHAFGYSSPGATITQPFIQSFSDSPGLTIEELRKAIIILDSRPRKIKLYVTDYGVPDDLIYGWPVPHKDAVYAVDQGYDEIWVTSRTGFKKLEIKLEGRIPDWLDVSFPSTQEPDNA